MRNFITKADNAAPDPSGILSAAEDNVRFSELENAVTAAGIGLDPSTGPDTDQTMLAQAMTRTASGGTFCLDSGVANAYVLSLSGSFVDVSDYFTGMEVEFYPGNNSSGASTINAFGLGVKKFFRADGSAIQALDVVANKLMAARYDTSLDSGNGGFKMKPWAIPPAVVGSTVTQSGEGISIDSGYHANLNYPGLTSTSTLAASDLFSLYQASSSHHRYITYANLSALIISQAALPAPDNASGTSPSAIVTVGATSGLFHVSIGRIFSTSGAVGRFYEEISFDNGSTWTIIGNDNLVAGGQETFRVLNVKNGNYSFVTMGSGSTAVNRGYGTTGTVTGIKYRIRVEVANVAYDYFVIEKVA